MFPESLNDLGLAKLGSGIAGAIVSMRFISGTWPERMTLAAGGGRAVLLRRPCCRSMAGSEQR